MTGHKLGYNEAAILLQNQINCTMNMIDMDYYCTEGAGLFSISKS